MKKSKAFNFGSAEVLTRAQMKKIVGGLNVPIGPCVWSGTCSNFPGTQYTHGADATQQAADGWCAAASCCTNVDCPGAN